MRATGQQTSGAERTACLPFFQRELELLDNTRVVVALGQFADDVASRELGFTPRSRFRHGLEATSSRDIVLLDSYHPSQRNTFTGLLTEPLLDDVLRRARRVADLEPYGRAAPPSARPLKAVKRRP